MSAVATKPALTPGPRSRPHLLRFWGSSIGLKLIMALTGVILSGFVLVHMLGNLQIFQGAEGTRRLCQAPPQGARPALGRPGSCCSGRWACTSGHTWCSRGKNQGAAAGLPGNGKEESSFASRSMTLTGPLLLAFIIYHILHMTTGTVHPDFHEGTVYRNLITGLRVVPVRSSTCSRWRCWGSTSGTASGACSRRWARTRRATTRSGGGSRRSSPSWSRWDSPPSRWRS